MTGSWPIGVLLIAYLLATIVQAAIDSRRDITSPFRRAELPAPGPGAWVVAGGYRHGAWSGMVPAARLTVTEDWICIHRRTLFSGDRTYVVERADVVAVAVFGGVGPGVGVVGRDGPSRLAVQPFTSRTVVVAQLDRLGWPHERRRRRLLRPFA